MAAHHKDVEDHLASSENPSETGPTQPLPCVAHLVNMRVGELELSENVARIRCDGAQASDEDDTTRKLMLALSSATVTIHEQRGLTAQDQLLLALKGATECPAKLFQPP